MKHFCQHLNLWSLEDRRIRADLTEVFKITRVLSSIKFSTFFEYSPYDRTRGHSLKLVKETRKTRLAAAFFSERTSDLETASLTKFSIKFKVIHVLLYITDI